MKKTLLLVLALLMFTATAFSYPNYRDPNIPKVPGGMFLWDGSLWVPAKGNASGVFSVDAEVSVTVVPPYEQAGVATASDIGSATANATKPLAVQLFGSDNSVIQRLFTAIVMGDGVNGNNMLPFAGYLWNGATWDRAPGSSSLGLKVNASSGTVAISNFPSLTPLQYWGVGAPQSYQCALATNAVTILSTLASFSANTYVEIQGNAKIRVGTVGKTVASMANMLYLAAGQEKGFRVGTSTFDLQIMADPAAIASLDMKIYPLY